MKEVYASFTDAFVTKDNTTLLNNIQYPIDTIYRVPFPGLPQFLEAYSAFMKPVLP